MENNHENLQRKKSKIKYFLHKIIILSATFIFTSCKNLPVTNDVEKKPLATILVGVHHLGEKFVVTEFYVEKYPGGPVRHDSAGNGWNCCVALSTKAGSQLSAEVRWRIADWSNAPLSEVGVDYKDVIFRGPYVASVPIERAENSGYLYIHFFVDGKVRAVVSKYGVTSPNHPVLIDDRDGGENATTGKIIKEIFPEQSRRNVRNGE